MQTPGFADTIVQVIEQHMPDLVTLDLSENNIQTLLPFGKLARVLPNLVNLNLASNNLQARRSVSTHALTPPQQFGEFNNISGLKKLECLLIAGNPIAALGRETIERWMHHMHVPHSRTAVSCASGFRRSATLTNRRWIRRLL